MSSAYAEWYKRSIGAQALMAKQLAGAAGLRYLAHDDLDGRSLWGAEPVWRLMHYAVAASSRSYTITVGVTSDRKVASLDFQVQ